MLRKNTERRSLPLVKGKDFLQLTEPFAANVGNLPTLQECAQMCVDSYNTENNNDMPAGWSLFSVSKPNNVSYFGKCYVRNLGTPNAQAVFAHRGTVLSYENIKADIKIALDLAPIQCDYARSFTMDSMEAFGMWDEQGDYNEDIRIIYAGHSLGAIIAEAMFGITRVNGYERCITFESPGSKNIAAQYWRNFWSDDVVNDLLNELMKFGETYLAGVNVINSCNEQAVRTFRLKDLPYDYYIWDNGPYFPITTSYMLNPFYMIGNTMDQHPIIPISELLQSGNLNVEAIENPIGLNAGYVEYLDGVLNYKYWKEYFRIIWDGHPGDWQKEFDNDINKYYTKCFTQLKITQQEASSAFFSLPNKIYNNRSTLFKSKEDIEKIIKDFVVIEKNDSEHSKCSIM